MLRKLVVTVAVLAAVAAAADFGIRLYSERVVADQIQSSLKLDTRPSVSFGGWPFIPHLLSGSLPSATVSAHDLVAQGVRLHTVSLTLRDVRFSSHRLITKGSGTIHAKSGTGAGVLTAADLNETLKSEGIPLTVTIHDGHATANLGNASVDVRVQLDGDTLVLTPSAAGGVSARVGLPVPIHGMHYTGLRLGSDEVRLTVGLKDVEIVLPP